MKYNLSFSEPCFGLKENLDLNFVDEDFHDFFYLIAILKYCKRTIKKKEKKPTKI